MAEITSQLILHIDKDSKTQSTYYSFGRQGTDSSKDSKIQEIWSSPAIPFVKFCVDNSYPYISITYIISRRNCDSVRLNMVHYIANNFIEKLS